MHSGRRLALGALLATLNVAASFAAGTIQHIHNPPPTTVGMPFLLTDGSVVFQGPALTDWYKLTPDVLGSYQNGSWMQLASLPADAGYVPEYFASAILADGRLVIVGGEYNNSKFSLTNMGAIYDPVKNTWAMLPAPEGWDYIGDSAGVVLADGRFVVGRKLDKRMAALDPVTLQWTELSTVGKKDFNAEEGWTLMPDGSILTVDVKNAPQSERYLPTMGQWLSSGSTLVDLHEPHVGGGIAYGPGLVYHPPGEVGPLILRPNGTVFATGALNNGIGHTAIYHPGSTLTDTGTWTVGPDYPNGDDAGDTFASLLPNGHVLSLSTAGKLYEFDGTQLLAGPVLKGGGIQGLMVLPTGQTIISGSNVQFYTSPGKADPLWAPTISHHPAAVVRGKSYLISGTQFNGLSQAAAFGDELETATNYPLVRITNVASGHVFYARTHGHSSMGVATGTATVSTNFDAPANMETGASVLRVVANGIASRGVKITVQ